MIGIRNMDMPKSCESCPFKHKYSYDYSECLAISKSRTFPNGLFSESRISDCPLIELEENKWVLE